MAVKPRTTLDYARGGRLPRPNDVVHLPVTPTGTLNRDAISGAWITVLQIFMILPLTALSMSYPAIPMLLAMSAIAALSAAAGFIYCTSSLSKIRLAAKPARVIALAVVGYVASIIAFGCAVVQFFPAIWML